MHLLYWETVPLLSGDADTLTGCWTQWAEEVRSLSPPGTPWALCQCLEAPADPPPLRYSCQVGLHRPWTWGRPACSQWRTSACTGRGSGVCAGRWQRSPTLWNTPPRRLLSSRCWSCQGNGRCGTRGGLWFLPMWWEPPCGLLPRAPRRTPSSSAWPRQRRRGRQILLPAFHLWRIPEAQPWPGESGGGEWGGGYISVKFIIIFLTGQWYPSHEHRTGGWLDIQLCNMAWLRFREDTAWPQGLVEQRNRWSKSSYLGPLPIMPYHHAKCCNRHVTIYEKINPKRSCKAFWSRQLSF